MTKLVDRLPSSQHPLYTTWCNMKSRCYNPKNPAFKNYGGRGIKVCERWLNSFSNFVSDMGEKPYGYTLERVDNEGDYTPVNCCWETYTNQNKNRRTLKISKINTTGVKGVVKDSRRGGFRVYNYKGGKTIHLGRAETLEKAIKIKRAHQRKS